MRIRIDPTLSSRTDSPSEALIYSFWGGAQELASSSKFASNPHTAGQEATHFDNT